MIGRAYTWRGSVWRVVTRWAGAGPRNVLLAGWRGERVVRPFRGMRRAPQWIIATSTCWHLSRRCAESGTSWSAFPLAESGDPRFYRRCRRCVP